MELNLNKQKKKRRKIKILMLVAMMMITSMIGVIFVSAKQGNPLDNIVLREQDNLVVADSGYLFTYHYYIGNQYIKDNNLSFQDNVIKTDKAIQHGVKSIGDKSYNYVGLSVDNKTVNLYYVCYNDFIDIEKTLSSPLAINNEYTLNFNVKAKTIPSFNTECNKIVLVIDTSRSMACSVDTDISDIYMAPSYDKTRWSTLVKTVSGFLDTVLSNPDNQVAIVTYAGTANQNYINFTDNKNTIMGELNGYFNQEMFDNANSQSPGCDVDDISNYVTEFKLYSGTNIADGIRRASSIIDDSKSNASVILMTDGAANRDLDGNSVNGQVASAAAEVQGNALVAKGSAIYSIAMVNGTLNSTITVSMGKNTFATELYQSSNYDMLKEYFQLIYTSICGLNINEITLTDRVNNNFTVIDNQAGCVNGQMVTFPVSRITTVGTTYSIKIKAASNKTAGASYTNGDTLTAGIGCYLNYKTIDGSSLVKECEDAPVAIVTPHASNDSYSVRQGQILTVLAPKVGETDTRLLANDENIILYDTFNKEDVTIQLKTETIEVAGKGTVVIASDGSFTFTPYDNALNNIEPVTFDYTLILNIKGAIYTTTASATINIIPKYNLIVNYYDLNKNSIARAYTATKYKDEENKKVIIDYSNIPEQYEFVKYSINGDPSNQQQPIDCMLEGDITYDIFFQYKSYPVTVEYYNEDNDKPFFTESLGNKVFGSTVDNSEVNVNGKAETGYKFKNSENFPLVINTNNNTIKIYYIKDENVTKTLRYTVEYYKDGIKAETLPEITSNVWINESDMIKVNTVDTSNDRYLGYKYDAQTTGIIPAQVTTGTTIKIYYSINSYEYTVNYYYDNKIDLKETVKGIAVFNTPIPYVKKDKEGYTFSKVENASLIITTDVNKNIINLYYEKDDSQTKTLSYTIKYFKDGVEVIQDEETVSEKVWINADNTITVKSINVDNKYTGYKFVTTDPQNLPQKITTDSVIKVNFVKDSFNYSIEYYYNNKLNPEMTETLKAVFGSIVTYTDKAVEGYVLSKVENENLTISDNVSKNVIKVYYTRPEVMAEEDKIPELEVAADEDAVSPQTNDSTDLIYVTLMIYAVGVLFIAAKTKNFRLNK